MNYDPARLAFLGGTSGPLFLDFSGIPGFGADVGGVPTAIFLVEGDFTEPLRLATLHFEALSAGGLGPTTISISGDPANPDQGLVYLSGADAISASGPVDIVPEPGTLAFCALGALAIGLKLRR